jgi:serine/threonine-protein kinase RsbW
MDKPHDIPDPVKNKNGIFVEPGRIRLKAELEAVRVALSSLIGALKQDGLEQEELSSVEIVLAETLNNIVLHAYADMGPGKIILAWSNGPQGYVFDIRDWGREMPDGKGPLSDQICAGDYAQTMPEGGFGWFLIRDLAFDILYRREAGENHLSFRMAIGKS